MSGAATARRVPALRSALVPGPFLRRRAALLAAACLLLAAGYVFWLRDSSLVRVREVAVTGLSGEDAARARAALQAAARTSTTLHVDRDAIARAAKAFPTIRALRVRADFPNGLTISVVEHRPAALLVVGARKLPVAGDGTLLTGMPTHGKLPEIRLNGRVPSRRLPPGVPLDSARVAGAAPVALAARMKAVVFERRRGLVVRLDKGPELVFGSASRAAAKWAAAARVLADPAAAGAKYVDLRIPERPAAGGLPVETVAPVAPAGPVPPGQARPTPEAGDGPGPAAQSPPAAGQPPPPGATAPQAGAPAAAPPAAPPSAGPQASPPATGAPAAPAGGAPPANARP